MTATAAAPAEPAVARRSPYQGLVPYTEADAEWFFGREEWTAAVGDNLRAYRIMVLYGASGVGKSSLLRAGLMRQLREEARENEATLGEPRLLPVAFSAWSLDDPIAALTGAVADGGDADGPLGDVLEAAATRAAGPVLLVLDQLEELFVYHDAPGDEAPAELAAALRRRDPAVHFLLSIREDSLARLDGFDAPVPGLGDHLIGLAPLDRDAAREAILRPLERWNATVAPDGEEWEIEPALVEAVLDQVAAGEVEVGAAGDASRARAGGVDAPYLQLVLERLWDEERSAGSHILRLQTLERLGGADRIVRTHLDNALAALPPRDQELAARTFRYLVTPSGTKIAHSVDDLADYESLPPERLEPLVETLAGPVRILRPAGDGRYEIYHDALAGSIVDWQRRWQERTRRRRERRRFAIVAGIAAVLALIAAALVVLTLRARDAQHVGHSRELAARSAVQLDVDPQAAIALAVPAADASQTDEAESALRASLAADRLVRVFRDHSEPVQSAAFSPDGTLIVTASEDGTALIKRADNGAQVATLRHPDSVNAAAFSPDGRRVVTAGNDGLARIWDVRSGRVVRVLRDASTVDDATFGAGGRLVVTATADGTAPIWDAATGRRVAVVHLGHTAFTAALSPDGELLVAAAESELPRIWDARSGRPVRTLVGHEDIVNSAAFSMDGAFVLTASDDGTAAVWETETGRRVAVLRGHVGGVTSGSFSPDGRFAVTGGQDGTARIWDLENDAAQVAVLRGHTQALTSSSFSPDGKLVLTSSYDTDTRIWDVRQHLAELRGHDGEVRDAAFGPDGRVVTAGADGTARVWRATGGRAVSVLRGTDGGLDVVAVSPDGTRFVTAGERGTAGVWDAATGRRLATLRGDSRSMFVTAMFSPDGRRILTADGVATVHVWDASTFRPVATLDGFLAAAAFDPDGRRVVTADADGTAIVWDAANGERVAALRGHDDFVNSAVFSPDGRRILTGSEDHTARIWDAETGEQLHELRGHDTRVLAAAFSPDGERVVTASSDQTARVWDASSGEIVAVLRGHDGRVSGAAFAPDGQVVLTWSIDGTARLWDARTGRSLAVFEEFTGPVNAAAFSRDGRLIVTATRDNAAFVYRCTPCGSLGDLLERARATLAPTS